MSVAEEPATGTSIFVDGGAFRVTRSGRLLHPEELVGSKLTVKDEKGGRQTVRIEQVVLDPADPVKELYLYDVRAFNAEKGEWESLCQPGPDGLALAFPLQGSWTSDGRHIGDGSFTMACSAGAIGKCVRWGYKPWRTSSSGVSLWDYHQACVRMVRADYCGNGTSSTKDGTAIDLYDRLGIQQPDDTDDLQFEAAWAPTGAICVEHPRIAKLTDFQRLCGDKLQPGICSRAATENSALLWNESAR